MAEVSRTVELDMSNNGIKSSIMQLSEENCSEDLRTSCRSILVILYGVIEAIRLKPFRNLVIYNTHKQYNRMNSPVGFFPEHPRLILSENLKHLDDVELLVRRWSHVSLVLFEVIFGSEDEEINELMDINFRNRTLQIPPITINDFTSTILINCVALEQCKQKRPKYLTDYVCFMSCLINQPRDVAFLCSDGVITRFSKDDQYVANLFNNLGKNAAFNIRDCHLSKQFREVESYYSSYWATVRRTYFSSSWSFISVLSAFVLLVLTLVQSIMSILSYKCQ